MVEMCFSLMQGGGEKVGLFKEGEVLYLYIELGKEEYGKRRLLKGLGSGCGKLARYRAGWGK